MRSPAPPASLYSYALRGAIGTASFYFLALGACYVLFPADVRVARIASLSPLLWLAVGLIAASSCLRLLGRHRDTGPARRRSDQRGAGAGGRNGPETVWQDTYYDTRSRMSNLERQNTLQANTVFNFPVVDNPFAALSEKTHSVWSPDLLTELEWRRFEQTCTAFLRIIQFRVATRSLGPLEGAELALHRPNQAAYRAIAHCRVTYGQEVGEDEIRAFFARMAAEKVSKGYYVITGDFSKGARALAKGTGMHLINGETFARRIRALPHDHKRALLQLATQGDFRTPSCEKCNAKMQLRLKEGRSIWSCCNYPHCRHRMVLPLTDA